MVCYNFSIEDDNLALEGNESFNVVLSSTTPGIVGFNNTALVVIQDNDSMSLYVEHAQNSDHFSSVFLFISCYTISRN